MDNLNTLAEATLSTYQPRMSNVTSSPSNSRVIERTPRTITLPVSGQILHVSVEAPDLSVARVGERIREGGHDVPEEKIGKCFDQNGAFIKQVVMLSDVAHIYHKSKLNHPPIRVLSVSNGKPCFVVEQLPQCALSIYEGDLSI